MQPVKFRNNMAMLGWGFSFAFLLMCVLFTYILFRDGSSHIQVYPPDIPDFYPPWVMPLVLALFWAAGLGLAAHMVSKPCVGVEIQPDRSVIIVYRYPLRRTLRHIQAADLAPACVVVSTDSDDDPYFECQISAADGFIFTIFEGYDREACESACARFNDVTGKQSAAA